MEQPSLLGPASKNWSLAFMYVLALAIFRSKVQTTFAYLSYGKTKRFRKARISDPEVFTVPTVLRFCSWKTFMFDCKDMLDIEIVYWSLTYLYLMTVNTNLKGSITEWLTSCLFCLGSAALLMLNEQQFYLFGQIQTSPTDGQLYSDTSPMVSVLCLMLL